MLFRSAHPVGVAVSPDGKWVYVATGHGNSVMIIDAATRKIVSTIPTGNRPWGVALSRDGSRLYTANGLSNNVTVIDTAARKAIATIPAGDGTWGVALQEK